MASHSSSLNLQDGADAAHQDPHEDAQQLKSDPDVPIDPSITAQSPTQYYPQTSPYGTAGDMQHYGHPSAVYSQPQPRPDWSGYGAHTPITPNHHGVFQHQQTTPTAARGGHGNQVFSFVPIPGSQQHKRPRRRYEEIERMYKCGWNGCEKAYGTLNHLNAHVTMQSHGQKRVPEEFKEIRKEWKARKKAEEQARKHQDEQARSDGQPTPSDPQATHDSQQGSVASYGGAHAQRLPPLGYNPNNYPTAPQFSSGAGEYAPNYITAPSGFPSSPYAQSHQQVYGQANGGQTH
ncbi:hypothetical protein N0V82_001160 [Gnomoniopsis sp. IMI 355080]|nr:hypothetical protein N0V82_001160 [Gnomoniopsis sp. IMI 355080]